MPNYVLVDPEAKTFEWLQLDGPGYRLAQSLSEGDNWSFSELTLDLNQFFAELPTD